MKALVLSSGGVDSTTCVSMAVEKHGPGNVATLSAFYGQRHDKELECASRVAGHYGLAHYEVDLSEVMRFSDCSLLSSSGKAIAHGSYAEQLEESEHVGTYVPFRNGLLLSSVAALAVSLFPDEEVEVYIGAHADDAAGNAYADCSEEFMEAMEHAIATGTYGKVRLMAPLVSLTKAQVVGIGLKLGTPYELTWSCYEGGERPCGECGTCIDRADAFAANGVADPAL